MAPADRSATLSPTVGLSTLTRRLHITTFFPTIRIVLRPFFKLPILTKTGRNLS